MRSVGWLLQLLALVIVGTALLVGLFYDALRAEIAMLAAGGVLWVVALGWILAGRSRRI